MEPNYSTPPASTDILHNDIPQETSGSLNVLTILTFIGCGLSYVSTLWGLVSGKNAQQQIDKIEESRDKVGDGFMGRWMDASVEMLHRGEQYKWINLGVALVFTTLCLIGALQMRKLKKQGFGIYAIGELLPIPIMFILMGVNLVTLVTGCFGALIAIIFTVLYARQRKYLVYP
ncbi:MAG: hypothetical protein JWP27_100 [Flaviaesturariibacter sp.]|nr:hypothetical protein [Flaviaesturariibacter sp.]